MGDAIGRLLPTLQEVGAALRNLRRPWPHQWPGLPLVFDRAWAQLDLRHPRKGSPAHSLLVFGRLVSEQVEQDGLGRHAQGLEPA